LNADPKPEENLLPDGATTLFTNDSYFGRLLGTSCDFVGASDFLSFDDAVSAIRSSDKRVALSVGDSSTSGWDTRVTVDNQRRVNAGEPLLSAFFRYKTYTDELRESLGDEFIVLNAGVPGHTSINCRRRLQDLLRRFTHSGIKVDYVSIYIGNNDCQWERNVEDKAALRMSLLVPLFFDRLRLKFRKIDTNHIRLRTNKRDFHNNLKAMVSICRQRGAAPMLIAPQTPLYWEPGKRFVADLYPVNESMPGGTMVIAALTRARELWQQVIEHDWSTEKEQALTSAREMDFVVPRIKKKYQLILEKISRDLETPLIKTSVPRETNDGIYFVDYCHPVGAANQAIAQELSKTMADYESGRIAVNTAPPRLMYRILDSQFVDFLATHLKSSKKTPPDAESEHKDIYTLY
jgi:lysophospholipase L1-like esterase